PEQAVASMGQLTLQALRDTVDAGAVQVFSTGNDAFDNPSVIGGIPYYFPELIPGWITVTSVDQQLQRSSFANACGVTQEYCIAAPGTAIYSTVPPSEYDTFNGTSQAAPHVTGAVALAKQMFPNAHGAQLASIVLRTATDIG